jgi:hypothetical protein
LGKPGAAFKHKRCAHGFPKVGTPTSSRQPLGTFFLNRKQPRRSRVCHTLFGENPRNAVKNMFCRQLWMLCKQVPLSSSASFSPARPRRAFFLVPFFVGQKKELAERRKNHARRAKERIQEKKTTLEARKKKEIKKRSRWASLPLTTNL